MLPDGTMVTGSPGVLTTFFPENLQAKEPAPPVALSAVQVNGRDTAVFFEKSPLLPYQSTLMFSYAALSFGNAAQNQYVYMLSGAEDKWSMPVHQTSVTFAKLPAGNYTFLVKGCNSDGVWNPEPVSFSFRIEAPFYLKAWFIALCVLAGAAAITAIYRYRLAQALRVEQLRTRLATDLHDDVGATLSAISMYSEALKKQVDQPQLAKLLGKIGDDSREMVRAMGDLVWAINPKNDGGDRLLQRMENFAADLCAVKGVTFSFQSDPKMNNLSIGIETRRNIFLIFKEAINNALKYSGCTQLNVQVFLEGNKLFMRVEDNGTGFDVSAQANGNGITNMHARAAEIGGRLNVLSPVAGGGCAINLQCPL
jgi:signal transduction histidine kinase